MKNTFYQNKWILAQNKSAFKNKPAIMLRENIFKLLSHLIWIDTISHLSNFWKLLGIIFTY